MDQHWLSDTTICRIFYTLYSQNFSSKILQDDGFEGLGFQCLATLYIVFAVSSFFSHAVIGMVGSLSKAMSGATLCYFIWISCFILPSKLNEWPDDESEKPWYLNKTFISTILLITAGINGAGAGILCSSEGKFLTLCACDENKGFFNSYFWAYF